ncbi:LuxR C-terminal-related transcriptional regulator [Nostocoides sp. HKS02]|uniref:helix-turn-helix transcriptional regulator n=1 Tax=Nostocoides sp. HKS02 TaxID=1813880 RepID=UPI0012B471C8|nr:LuxR C-terminal-related transcriptional regulator [Tetrasphaera sp. HKS02]QGN57393.1 hypothetical protein GKE56_05365 [Tetrasphaera sp. HKS02]
MRLSVEAAHLAVRGQPYGEFLADCVHRELRADAGAGLTVWAAGADGTDHVTVDVAGQDPVEGRYLERAKAVVAEHPSFSAGMPERATHRVSDLTPMGPFWDSEPYEAMHGFCGGRYPAALTLLATPTTLVFLGIHRSRHDFSDEDMRRLDLVRQPLAGALTFRNQLDHAAHQLQQALPATVTFTDREAEVLALVARGWTDRRIARRLGITDRTVRKRLATARERVGAHSRAHAAALWSRLNP